MRLLAVGALVTPWGCTVTGPGSAVDVHLALGGTWTIDPDSLCDGCYDEVDEVRDVFPEVEGVVEVVDIGPTTFTLASLRSGDTDVTVSGLDRGSDVVERYAHAIVRRVNRFSFGDRCNVTEPSTDPYIVPPASELEVMWILYDTEMNALAGDPALQTNGIEVLELDVDPTFSRALLRMPDDPGTIELTSPLYDPVVARFEVHAPGDFDDFEAEVWPDTPFELDPDTVRRVQTALLVDGRRVCLDLERRVVEVLTPETCNVGGATTTTEVTGPDVWIGGLAEGTCTLRITVPDHGFEETLSVEIVAA